jgi:hypothetical protein
MPLMSCGLGKCMVVICGVMSCEIVLLLLKVTLKFVFLSRLVIFLTCGEACVKVAHFVSCMETGEVWLVDIFLYGTSSFC